MQCPFCDEGIKQDGRRCRWCRGGLPLCDRCGEPMRGPSYPMPVRGLSCCRRCMLKEPTMTEMDCVRRYEQARWLVGLIRKHYGAVHWDPHDPGDVYIGFSVPVVPMSDELHANMLRLKPEMIAILRGEYQEAHTRSK